MRVSLRISLYSFGISFVLAGCGTPESMPPTNNNVPDSTLCSPHVPGGQITAVAGWAHMTRSDPASPPSEAATWVANLPASLLGTKATVVDITARLPSSPDEAVHDLDGKPVLRWAGTLVNYQDKVSHFSVTEQPTPVPGTALAGVWTFMPENSKKISIENYNKTASFLINFTCE